eukprot:s4858_g2.t1
MGTGNTKRSSRKCCCLVGSVKLSTYACILQGVVETFALHGDFLAGLKGDKRHNFFTGLDVADPAGVQALEANQEFLMEMCATMAPEPVIAQHGVWKARCPAAGGLTARGAGMELDVGEVIRKNLERPRYEGCHESSECKSWKSKLETAGMLEPLIIMFKTLILQFWFVEIPTVKSTKPANMLKALVEDGNTHLDDLEKNRIDLEAYVASGKSEEVIRLKESSCLRTWLIVKLLQSIAKTIAKAELAKRQGKGSSRIDLS